MNDLSPQLLKHYQESFDEIQIHPDAERSQVAERFKTLFPEKIKPYSPKERPKGILNPKEFDQSKRNILIQPYLGTFFKQCPGGNKKSACCNYFVLNLGSQCHFNCSYCYLQSFLNQPYMVVYSNIEDALDELDSLAQSPLTFRVGTGEVIDSLGLDPITEYSKKLIKHLSPYPNVALELKTKSNFVDHLLDIENKGSAIISWSINPDFIIQKEEHLTASLEERLQAAKKSVDAGYKISFHIDPIIWHEDWEANYSSLVTEVCNLFSPEEVPFVSLGALRFQPEQTLMMKQRFSRSSLVNSAEVFPSKDGKMRFDANLRASMFSHIINTFKKNNPKWKVFLCMESPETWLSTYGSYPGKVDGLEDLFSPRPKNL